MRILKTILSLVAPVGLLRLYGGGGDGGAGEMREAEAQRQAKVQAAVDAINGKFGIAGAQRAAPAREAFMRASQPGAIVGTGQFQGNGGTEVMTQLPGTPDTFDEAGFNQAMAAYQQQDGALAANKTGREALYTDIQGATKDTAMRGLDRQFGDASRKNTFGLARAGLLGGSVDAESGGELSELYGEGQLKAAQAGQQAASDLRSTDEKTRQNLIGLAQSGLDTGTAASLAAGQMGAAADAARSQTAGANVGRLFDDLSQGYLTNQQLKGRYPNGLPQQAGGYGSNLWGAKGYSGNVQP